jgi:uncharacterized membrane protein
VQQLQAQPYTRSAGFGAIAGVRSMAPVALLSRYLTQIPHRFDADVLSVLQSPRASRLLAVLALGEMAADKLPFVPSRTSPIALAGRVGSGALVGAALAQHEGLSPWRGGLSGGIAALAATFVSHRLRLAAIDRLGLPNALAGLLEDGLVVGGGLALLRR